MSICLNITPSDLIIENLRTNSLAELVGVTPKAIERSCIKQALGFSFDYLYFCYKQILIRSGMISMKHFLCASFAVIAFSVTSSAQASIGDWAQFGRYESANAEVKIRPKAVFFGDSITDAWARKDPGFFTSNNFVGRGISGQTTAEMVVRMRQDVIDLHPKYMVLLAGINDIAMNNGTIEIENVFGNIVSMVELAKANKIRPVLCLVFPTTEVSWRREVGDPTEKINELNGLIAGYARKNNIPLVEYMKDADKSSGCLPKTLSDDSIHPNIDGYKIMEAEIMKVLK